VKAAARLEEPHYLTPQPKNRPDVDRNQTDTPQAMHGRRTQSPSTPYPKSSPGSPRPSATDRQRRAGWHRGTSPWPGPACGNVTPQLRVSSPHPGPACGNVTGGVWRARGASWVGSHCAWRQQRRAPGLRQRGCPLPRVRWIPRCSRAAPPPPEGQGNGLVGCQVMLTTVVPRPLSVTDTA